MSEQNTREVVQKNIVELKRRLKEHEELLKSLGLPVEGPEPFVEVAHTVELVAKTELVAEVLASYLQILNEGKSFVPFPVATLLSYKDDLTLIEFGKERTLALYGKLLLQAIDLVEDAAVKEGQMTYEYVVRRLYELLSLATKLKESGLDSMEDEPFIGDDLIDFMEGYKRHLYDEVLPVVELEKSVLEAHRKQLEGDEGGELL